MTDLYDPDGSGVLVTRKEMTDFSEIEKRIVAYVANAAKHSPFMANVEQYFRQMLNAETMMLAMRKELERQFPAGFWEFPDCFVANSTAPPDKDFETWSGIPLTGPISGEVLVSVYDSRCYMKSREDDNRLMNHNLQAAIINAARAVAIEDDRSCAPRNASHGLAYSFGSRQFLRRMRLAYPHRPDSKRRRKQRLQKRARRITRLNRK